jgi:Holliday junction resolvase RusA-like endonuclease
VIVVELPGQPQGKGRPRFRAVTTKTGRSFATAYTPAKSRSYEAALAWAAKLAMQGRTPLYGPLKVTVTAYMAVPPSWSNKKRDAALAGALRPVTKPDGDNIEKGAWDAMKTIVWLDDAQIVDGRVLKFYDERPRLRIEVSPLEVFEEDSAHE